MFRGGFWCRNDFLGWGFLGMDVGDLEIREFWHRWFFSQVRCSVLGFMLGLWAINVEMV